MFLDSSSHFVHQSAHLEKAPKGAFSAADKKYSFLRT